MSLDLRDVAEIRDSFPRVSGDEPVARADSESVRGFSPRERG